MSKLAHTYQKTMDEIDLRRAIESGNEDLICPMKECPNCHNANQYGDYEGPTCQICLGDGFVPDQLKVDAACRDCGHVEPCDDKCPNSP